jgi:hypothetical protein
VTHSPREVFLRFLATGQVDPSFRDWPGSTFADRERNGSAMLREALIAEVRRRTRDTACPALPPAESLQRELHSKFQPMVAGLFPRTEQAVVLSLLERSVVFLTPATIVPVLQGIPWLGTAWDLANVYLAGVGGDSLAPDEPRPVGLNVGTTCYVSPDYFTPQSRFDDYVIHEAAHIFHNCKRKTLGLPSPRRQEWLLGIDYFRRETFAYACEAYSRIRELGHDRTHRQELLAERTLEPLPADSRVDGQEYLDILGDALVVRNGWKRILARCAPATVSTMTLRGGNRVSIE